MSKETVYIYQYRFRFDQFLNLIIGFGLLSTSLYLFVRFELDNTLVAIICSLFLIGITPISLTFNYLTQSLGVSIRIDQNNGTFEVTNNGRTNTLKLGEITSMEICEQKSIGLYGFDFSFAKYTFSNGNFCIATNHMTNQYFIPTGIEPRVIKEIFPIIWKQTNV